MEDEKLDTGSCGVETEIKREIWQKYKWNGGKKPHICRLVWRSLVYVDNTEPETGSKM